VLKSVSRVPHVACAWLGDVAPVLMHHMQPLAL